MKELLCTICWLFVLAIIGRVILSWFPVAYGGTVDQIHRFLIRVTEPVMAPVRQVLPNIGPIDISPLVVLLFVQIVVMQLLLNC